MAIIRFLHLTIFGFTAVLPLLGASSATVGVSWLHIAGLLAVAFCYHTFAYLLNDIVDLPIDHTQPTRAGYPLVRGDVTPRQALLLALAVVPPAFGLAVWLGGGRQATLALAVAFVAIAVYDWWGKRCPLPPLTDLVQGVAWGALLLHGAILVDGSLTPLSWGLTGYVVGYIVLVNGVNASLRDLTNDWRYGVRSTAIWLGARPGPGGGLSIPARVRWYAIGWQLLLLGLSSWLLWGGVLRYDTAVSVATGLVVVLLHGAALILLLRMTRPTIERAQSDYMGHIFLLLLALLALCFPHLSGPLRLTILAVFLLPLLTADWLHKRLAATIPVSVD